MYKQANKVRLRFVAPKHASVTVEDLQSLPLTHLKSMANQCHQNITAPSDLFAVRDNQTMLMELRLEILLDVIKDRTDEAEAKSNATAVATANKAIDQLIIKKQEAAMNDLSIEQLIAMKK